MSMTGDTRPRTDLAGRRALVTGAARGIGRSIAERLARSGAAVTLADLDARTLSATVGELQSQRLDVSEVAADVTVEADVERMVSAAAERWGGLDIVVANAGRMTHGGVEANDMAALEAGLRINLVSTFMTCRAALPHVRSSAHGRLVLMASMAAFDPRTVTGVAYALSKAAITHLAGILSIELTGSAATANAIAPAAVLTEMSSAFGEDVLAAFAARSPLGRIAVPDDVADVALFLASDLGGFVNGQTIRISGGP
jgi:3-oxoacyl-[acyl-carrier protein] reductase